MDVSLHMRVTQIFGSVDAAGQRVELEDRRAARLNFRRFCAWIVRCMLPAVLLGRAYTSPEPSRGAGGCRSLSHTQTRLFNVYE